jgi:hypothetical protein
MPIVDDYAAIAAELRRLHDERLPEAEVIAEPSNLSILSPQHPMRDNKSRRIAVSALDFPLLGQSASINRHFNGKR